MVDIVEKVGLKSSSYTGTEIRCEREDPLRGKGNIEEIGGKKGL